MEYRCICCGTCCQKYQPRLDQTEIPTLAGMLGLTPAKFISEYTDPRWPGTRSFLLTHRDGACVFLYTTADHGLSLCRIHAFKPACCRDWAAGTLKPECQAGLHKLLGITVDSTAGLVATSDQLLLLAERIKAIDEL